MSKLPVTVLSGFLGAGKTSVIDRFIEASPDLRIAVLVSDPAPAEGDAEPSASEGRVEFSGGCFCCSLQQELIDEIARIAGEGRHDLLLIEAGALAEPAAIAEAFFHVDENGDGLGDCAALASMITVVDAEAFLQDFRGGEELADLGLPLPEDDDRSVVDALVDQVEFCDLLVVNKVDLASPEDLLTLEALLRQINPGAEIVRARDGAIPPETIRDAPPFDFERVEGAAGWMRILRGEGAPDDPATGACGVAYRARRPFHPERLWAFMQGEMFDDVLRSKGFLWLATRNDMAGLWSQSASSCRFDPAGFWWASVPAEQWPEDSEIREEIERNSEEPFGDRRQELALIGIGLDRESIRAGLDFCLLTDEELAAGEAVWAAMEDPFPEWPPLEEEGGDSEPPEGY